MNLTRLLAGLCSAIMMVLLAVAPARAVTPPGPQGGSVGVEATISSDPPKQPASIVQPANGQGFSSIPVAVSGLCPASTLVKVYSNNIFVGSAACVANSYSLQVSLFSGRNDLVARVFDALDQQGPDSNIATVSFNDAQFSQFASHVLITSQYARRAAQPNSILEWPVVITSGIGPYAVSADWGDNSGVELSSQPFAGTVTLKHTYKSSGVYKVTFKVVDANGTAGFLQVVAVATGTVTGTTATGAGKVEKTVVTQHEVLVWPMAVLMIPTLASFWLGRRFELTKLRKRLEQTY